MSAEALSPGPDCAAKGTERWKSVTRSVALRRRPGASRDRIAAETWLTFRLGIIAATPLASISVPWASRAA